VKSPQKHHNSIDLLRYFLALAVLWSHCWPLTQGSNLYEPVSVLSKGQTSAGSLAVLAFFGLSGYLITRSWQRQPSLYRFGMARMKRIYPAYIVAAIISLIVVLWIESPAWNMTIFLQIMQSVLLMKPLILPVFVNNPFPYSINGPVWTLRYEMWCYLMVAALGLSKLLQSRTIIAIIFAAMALAVVQAIVLPDKPLLSGIPFLRWPLLVMAFGMGALMEIARIPLNSKILWGSVLMLVVSLYVPPLLVLMAPVLITYITLFVAMRLTVQPMWESDLSYGLYLYSFPVQQITVALLGAMHPLLLFALAWPITHMCAWLSWHLIEIHFLRHRRSSLPREAQIVKY
jgi:peptidoglycan/LPS O-acetylase OafA/YrhL